MNLPRQLLCLFFVSTVSAALHAGEAMMVDKADSLDFQGFHDEADKREAEKKSAEATSIKYSTNPATMAANGDFFVVSERYSPTTPSQTRYSAFSVINVLHERMAQHCPDGFEILRQWSVPVERDFLLNYGFVCLAHGVSTK